MRRRLTSREIVLIIILVVLVLVSGYYLLFYVPVQNEKDSLTNRIEDTETEISVDQARVEELDRMKAELEAIFAGGADPASMAPFDNWENVMNQLNGVLSVAEDYSIDFATVDEDGEDGVIRRKISLSFTCADYASARDVLQQLHDSPYRCMIDDLNVDVRSRGQAWSWWDGTLPEAQPGDITVDVSTSIIFFEYQP